MTHRGHDRKAGWQNPNPCSFDRVVHRQHVLFWVIWYFSAESQSWTVWLSTRSARMAGQASFSSAYILFVFQRFATTSGQTNITTARNDACNTTRWQLAHICMLVRPSHLYNSMCWQRRNYRSCTTIPDESSSLATPSWVQGVSFTSGLPTVAQSLK